MGLRKGDRISPLVRTGASMGLSYFAIVIWENIEFLFDYFWYESELQRYGPGAEDDCMTSLFVKIFGPSANNNVLNEDGDAYLNQWPLFDTNLDMLYAVIACGLAGLGLFIYLCRKEKKEKLADKEKETVIA